MGKALTSIIIPALNQGHWLRETIARAKESMRDRPYEIIVIDDHSTDGCCHDLPKDVLVALPKRRLGVSGARRYGVWKAQGDIFLFTDAHCHYPDHALYHLCNTAENKRAIVQPCTTSLPEVTKLRYGGQLVFCDRGLKVGHKRREPAKHPALLGSIYCMRRDVYEVLGGWPELPGVWGYSEQAMTLAAWFMGMPIFIEQRAACNHQNYHPRDERGRQHFTYSVPLVDQSNNGHYMFAAFFPDTYPYFWRPILDKRFRTDSKYSKSIRTGRFRDFRRMVHLASVRTERQFFEQVIEQEYPPITDEAYVAQQQQRSEATEFSRMHARMKLAIDWMIRHTGQLKGKSVFDVGTRDGACLDHCKRRGAAHTKACELIPEVAEYAASKGRNVVVGDARKLPEKDASFDVVTSIHCLEHVPAPEVALSEMLRICKPGGTVFIVVPREGILPDRANKSAHNVQFGNEEQLRSLVASNRHVDKASIRTVVKQLHRGQSEIRVVARKKGADKP